METIRLDKFLSSQLNISRTDAKKLIREKRITLDPAQAAKPETQVSPETSHVFMDGVEILFKAHIYLMMHKPAGVVSATKDAEKTVLDLVPPPLRRTGLFPAGRLDKDTTGFVLITDDGAFAHEILSPAHHIEKAYIVTLERAVTPEEEKRISLGLPLGDVILKPAFLRPVPFYDAEYAYEIVLTEGRYHQIKRMFASMGNRVTSLHRIRIGNVSLDPDLAPGECRALTAEEMRALGLS